MTTTPDGPVKRAQRAYDALIDASYAVNAHRRGCRDYRGVCAECARLYGEHGRATRRYDAAIAVLLGDVVHEEETTC